MKFTSSFFNVFYRYKVCTWKYCQWPSDIEKAAPNLKTKILQTIVNKNEKSILGLKSVVSKEIRKLANQIENEERLIKESKDLNQSFKTDKFINEILFLFNTRIY